MIIGATLLEWTVVRQKVAVTQFEVFDLFDEGRIPTRRQPLVNTLSRFVELQARRRSRHLVEVTLG